MCICMCVCIYIYIYTDIYIYIYIICCYSCLLSSVVMCFPKVVHLWPVSLSCIISDWICVSF